MFVLVEIKDTVRIPPWLFNVRFNDAVVEALKTPIKIGIKAKKSVYLQNMHNHMQLSTGVLL
jgi:DNA-directed RNA polymerase subunit E'/Rpb7